MYVCIYVCMYISMFIVYIYVCVYMYVLCFHTDRHWYGETFEEVYNNSLSTTTLT